MKTASLLVTCMLTLLTACATRTPASVDDLIATDRAFSEFSAQHGPHAAWDKYLDDKAVDMSAGQDFVFDKATTLKGFDGFPATTSLTWTPIGGDIAKSGDLGYTFGRYIVKNSAGSASRESHGKYVTVWKRQADGAWKVVFDGGNTSRTE
ncbi:MAG TPA: DUF4440 domain-containing protein [Pseudomonadales bacterium]|nr:DUF4440 domain-containing protein [Pseudomonadales bacterium]